MTNNEVNIVVYYRFQSKEPINKDWVTLLPRTLDKAAARRHLKYYKLNSKKCKFRMIEEVVVTLRRVVK